MFSGGHFNYFSQSATEATAWCGESPNGLQCHPQDLDVFDFSLYSTQGYVYGRVTKMPTGEPVVGMQVLIQRQLPNGGWNFDCGGRFTDQSGEYTFKNPLNGPNNWGCLLNPPTTPGSPGMARYRIGGPPDYDFAYQTIHSNTSGRMDLVRKETGEGYEEPPRCGGCGNAPTSPSPSASSATSAGPSPGTSTPSCRVGNPVSVTTGNVDLDQTDAVIPGRGLGLRFSRSYNSKNIDAGEYDAFGPGWSHAYEKRLTFHGTAPRIVIKLRDGTGMPLFYQDVDNNNGVFLASMPFTKESQIVRVSATEYRLVYRRGGSETYFRPGGTGAARLASLTDAAGNVTTLTYDAPTAAGRLTGIADPGGRQLTLAYQGSSRRPVSLTGPGGLIATFTYAPAGSLPAALQSVTYADGDGDGAADGAFTFAYHPHGRLWTVTDGAGKVLETHVYTGERATQTSRSGEVEKYTLVYDDVYNTTTVTDVLGHVTTYTWQNVWGARQIIKIVGPCAGCGGGSGDVQEWGYDLQGRVTSYKDGEGNVTAYEYDADGNLIYSSLPSSGPNPTDLGTHYTYHPDGRMNTRTAPNGGVTTWTYVAAGPQTITETISLSQSRTTHISYTPQGKPEVITDPTSRQTTMHHNTLGDLDWIRDHVAHQTSFEYDVMGRLEKTILPATTPPNDSPRTSYDTLGHVWRVMNPNGSFWRHFYDGGGRRVLTRDPELNETGLQYDAYGRVEVVVDALNGETHYGYDLMSNLVSLTDARDKTTEFEYDGHHRVKKVTYPGQIELVEEFTYDAAGRLKTRTDRKGVTTTFAYDAQGRVTGKTYSDGSPAVSFGYDGNGDLGFMTSASNSADTLTWDFDLAGQLTSEASTRNATTVSYLYDLAGRRTVLRLNGSDVLSYDYELDGQLDKITRITGVVFDFTSDPAHRRQNLVFPNGTTTEYGYDLLSRVSLIRLKRGTTVLNDIAYVSNDLNNRTSRTENGTRLEYDYDPISRLTTVDRMVPTPVVRQEEYTYDPVGNRLTALGIPGLWSYGEGNELLAYNGINFTYDLNGNQISRSGSPARTYVWDVENRLASARDNGVSVASFEYDPLGRRVTKTTTAGLTRFAYDGEDILLEQSPPGPFTYLHGPGIDEPLAREGANKRTYYHADGLGSIVKRTDATGNVFAAYAYDSFGQGAALANGYAFTGRDWVVETGLYDYRARYYDAKVGRFVSQDPIRWAGGVNLYSYVRNNPINLIDPNGEQSQDLKDFYDALPKARPKPGATDSCAGGLWFMAGMGVQVGTGQVNDKVGHCLAHCEIVKQCPVFGKAISPLVGYGKECFDDALCNLGIYGNGWDDNDVSANKTGASCPASQSCIARCSNANLQIHSGRR